MSVDPGTAEMEPSPSTAVANSETWTDEGAEPVTPTPVIESRATREQRRHLHALQSRLLTGLGVIFLLVLLLVVAAPALGWVSEEYGRTLAQMVIPALLTFGGAIVGTLFNAR